NFVSNYNLDGVDIYWTYPTTNQAGANFLSLMTDLNKSLVSKKTLTSITSRNFRAPLLDTVRL
ncbi:hypothetical protein KBA63_03635, partial [Candidatus Woesebacteria bacterium]|nr:hypothetical protein [Candidatus Woesebacteria bacterium]